MLPALALIVKPNFKLTTKSVITGQTDRCMLDKVIPVIGGLTKCK